MVLPDRERAAARVKTHVHRKSSQEDSQCSLSSRFTVCAVYTAPLFSVRSVSLVSTEPWVPPTQLVRDSPLAICVCYCISYCISLIHALLSVRPVCAFLQERAISRRTRSPEQNHFFSPRIHEVLPSRFQLLLQALSRMAHRIALF